MPPLPPWLLPLVVFGVWTLWAFAAIADVRAREIRRGTPKEQRGGVSILPVIPMLPLFFWGAGHLGDIWFAPWGSVVIGGFHLILAAAMTFTLVRDMRYCRRYERAQQCAAADRASLGG